MKHSDQIMRSPENAVNGMEAEKPTPETSELLLAYVRAVGTGTERPAIWPLMKALERERNEMRDWIRLAAPVLESACCALIEENVDRLDEIPGCQGLMETCPVSFVRMPHLIDAPENL